MNCIKKNYFELRLLVICGRAKLSFWCKCLFSVTPVCKLCGTETPAKATKRLTGVLIGTITGAVVALTLLVGVLIFVCKRKSKKALTGETTLNTPFGLELRTE